MAKAEQDFVPDLIFDYQTIAEQVRQFRKRRKKTTPSVAKLATAITSLTFEDTIFGSSTLTIEIIDVEWELIDFFNVDEKGHIDPIDFNYPLDSDSWWRLNQLDLTGGVEGERLKLTCIERPVAWLMHKHGPKKASRGKMTRAEFFKSLVDDVKAGRGLRFVSHELHVDQPVVGAGQVERTTPTSDHSRSANKHRGIANDAHLKVKGASARKEQVDQMNRVLDVAAGLHAGQRATHAAVCAAIGESSFIVQKNPRSVYSGIFQADPANIPMDDTEEQARCFLKGGKGFQMGGAISLAHNHKDFSSGDICWRVEGNRSNFTSDAKAAHFYDVWSDEADEIIKAYGGGFTGGSTFYRQQYNFQIGTEAEPHQTYWDGMTNLAEEVRWRLFCSGRTIYFDSDMTLISQRPAWTVKRSDPAVISYSATWDERRIATGMEITLICDPFAYRAGDVFVLEGFGPLSDGSTAKEPLPGRWLITNATRSSGDLTSTFTLAQPELPKREPRADIGERAKEDESTGDGIGDLSDTMTPKEVIDELVIPIAKKHKIHACSGKPITPSEVAGCNSTHGPTVSGGRSDHQGPPNVAWAADMFDHNQTQSPDATKAALADELATVFDFKNGVHKNHRYEFGVDDTNHKGFRFQLGYLVEGHYNHVHFGAKRIATTPAGPGGGRPDTAGNPNV